MGARTDGDERLLGRRRAYRAHPAAERRARTGDDVNARLRRWLQPRIDAFERRRASAMMIRAGDPLAAQFASFGRGSYIAYPRLFLQNPGAVAIGDDVEIRSYFCVEAY